MRFSVREGAQTPAQVLYALRETCTRRLAMSDNADAVQVLAALDRDQGGALAYAQSVIEYEALPYGERQRVKAERTIAYLKDSMRGKDVTPAQLRFLQTLGDRGARPVDRAAASALIDQLQGGQA